MYLGSVKVGLEESEEKSTFLELMERTAAWLADEIYLHPMSAAAQKYYELISEEKLGGVYSKHLRSREEFLSFLPNFMENGFGQPRMGRLRHLARLTFPYWRIGAVFGRDEYHLTQTIAAQLSNSTSTHVSVLKNAFSQMIHVDLLFDESRANSEDIGALCIRASRWVVRLIEAQSLRRLKRLRIEGEMVERFRQRLLTELVENSYPAVKSLFDGIVRYVLPDDLTWAFSEFIPEQGQKSLGLRLEYVRGGKYDSLIETLENTIEQNPNPNTQDRIHELKALNHVAKRSSAPFLAACLNKFIVQDSEGRHRDDWDGVILEVFNDKVVFSIIEAKNLRTATRSENQAFKQLKTTRDMILSKRKLKSRRKRLPALGAVISFSF